MLTFIDEAAFSADQDADALYPLSLGQQALWYIHQQAPTSTAYHCAFACRIYSAVDGLALRMAFQSLVDRHAALRTTITVQEDQLYQCVHHQQMVDFVQLTVSVDDPEQQRQAVSAAYQQPFDLVAGPLLRVRLFTSTPNAHILLIVVHHIVFDGWSMQRLLEELRITYPALRQGVEPVLPPLPPIYSDYVAWQNVHLTQQGETLCAAWRDLLVDAPALLNLPTDHPRPPQQRYVGASHCFRLAPTVIHGLQALVNDEGATLYTVLLTAFTVLLYRYTGQEDLLVGVPAAARVQAKFADTLGYFTNLLPVRSNLAGNPTFRQLLQQTKQNVFRAQMLQAYPFSRLVQQLKIKRDPSYLPLVQVACGLQIPISGLEGFMIAPSDRQSAGFCTNWAGLQIAPFPLPQQEGQMDLSLDLEIAPDAVSAAFKYNTDLFEKSTIARLAGHFETLLASIIQHPDQPILSLPLLTAAEHRQIVEEWNDTCVDFGEPQTIHALFEKQAAYTPDAIALIFEDVKLTYADLNARANQLAHYLIDLGVQPDTLIAVAMERSLEMVVSLLAILKAGGAYVPIDPTYPSARVRYMFSDSAAPILLTQSHLALAQQLEEHIKHVIAIDRVATQLAAQPHTNPVTQTLPEHLAYVIYTSGSTGQPKGVANQHDGVFNRLRWAQQRFQLTSSDRVLQKTPFSFDVSVWEFFWTLMSGACLVVAQPEGHKDLGYLCNLIQRQQITLLHFVPSMLRQFITTPTAQNCSSLRAILTSGEALPLDLAQAARKTLPGTELHNLYGPTEAAVDVSHWAYVEDSVSVPIGKPIANTTLYILDNACQLLPIGVAGELYIGGIQLARAYLNRPDLTGERFIEHSQFGRLYKTGDLCRWLPDGNIEYLGRTDFQIKLRGFRVELGEIESVLLAQAGVREAVVVAREDRVDDKRLVAYVVQDATGQLALTTLRTALQSRLPEYMVPAAFVQLETMPLTPNGKLDRAALPAPDYADSQHEFVAPRNLIEEQLAEIWTDLLGQKQVGIYDNFFALGGHSLLATQAIARMRKVFAVELTLPLLFANPTIAAHAQAVLAAQQQQPTATVLPTFPLIQHAIEQRYAPFPLTAVQNAYWVGRNPGFELGNIAAHLYFEFDASLLDVRRLNQAWQQLVARHEMLRAIIQPDGQQRILADPPPYEFVLTDLTNLDAAAVQQTLATIRHEMSHQVLAAEQWPLFDIRLTRLNTGQIRLHISLDALILDGASVGVLFNEWRTLYLNPQTELRPLAVSFRDYVLAEKAFEESADYQQAWRYWEERLATLPPAPELPLQRDGQTIGQPRFQAHRFQLAAAQWTQLKRYGHRAGLTDSAIILSAFAEILTQWSKQAHFTLNLTLFDRLPVHPQINEIVGDFTPLLLLEVDHRNNPASALLEGTSFQSRAQQLQQQLWRDLDHRMVNGVHVLRELAQSQGHGPNRALMPVVFTSLLTAGLDDALFTWLGERLDMSSQTPQVWLDHVVMESAGGVELTWNVVEGLFPTGMIEAMFAAYRTLLQRLVTDEAAWQADRSMGLPQDQHRQREQVNATAAPLSTEMLHTLFLQQVERRAFAPAVITSTQTLHYQELYRRANQVGHWLRERAAKPNRLVAVVMEKGWEQVVAVLGIHLAGAAYLPVDPGLPTERLHYLLAQGEVALVLTQSSVAAAIRWPAGITWLTVDSLTPDETLAELGIVQTPTDLAYVIYTSGSTGLPKGVMIDHRGAVNTVLDVNRRYGVTADDRILALSALNFDLSVYDIFGLLAAGGAIVMPEVERRLDPEHWHELIQRYAITIWDTVPALMQMLVDYRESSQLGRLNGAAHLVTPSALRLVMLSGDWIPVTLPNRIKALWPGVIVYGMGGATEASIWSNYYRIEQVDPAWPSIPYGKPLTNQFFQVLDANLNPRPDWASGDLYIGGVGLALGYWKDDAKTNERFIIHPRTGERLYKTGDLARYLPASPGDLPNLEFLGREDFQVKIRGHRIELGEIESMLLQHPDIQEAVVNVVGDPKGDRQLVGYVVLTEGWSENQQNIQGDLKRVPDVYEQRQTAAITDPIERLEFKLRQPGIRQLASTTPIALPPRAFDETRRHSWLARQSYRQFLDEVIPLDTFSDFLSCLQQMPLDNVPLPKYRYPSAGNLYPVQIYLCVKAGRIAGLPGGYYYYHPAHHQLIPLLMDERRVAGDFKIWGANQSLFTQAAFTLFLVTDLAAITPLYGDMARDFSLLEAGYMSQLLMTEAPQYALGLCPIGGMESAILQSALALGEHHHPLHCLAGGRIDPHQPTQWPQPAPKAARTAYDLQPSSWLQQLQHYLAQKLPDYMIPSTFVQLPAMPLTSNGKLDRRALPIPEYTSSGTDLALATTFDEARLLLIWQEVLGVNPIGVEDNFFELGGHSLLATQLAHRMRQTLQRDFSLKLFFDAPTIRGLLRGIYGEQTASTSFVPLRTGDRQNKRNRRPLFLVHALGGDVFRFANLLPYLSSTQPIYALQARGIFDDLPPFASLDELVTTTIGEMKTIQPYGPYAISGWSFGGVVAFEIARQLTQQGEEVAFLGLLDTSTGGMGEAKGRGGENPQNELQWFFYMLGDILRKDDYYTVNHDLFAHAVEHEEPILWVLDQMSEQGHQLVLDPAIVKRMWLAVKRNQQFTEAYTLQPYAGTITLFCTNDLAPDDLVHWQTLTPHPVEAVLIDGNHITMMDAEYIETLGRELEKRLQQIP